MKRLDETIEKLLAWFCRILHISASEKTLKSLTQFVEFGLVGVTNSLISYGVNVAVLALLRPYHVSWDYVVANIVAFLISVLWSYYWNSRFVFPEGEGQQRSTGQTLLKTYIAYAFTGIILTNLLSYLWVDVVGISRFLSPLINIVICMPVNYLINKHWAFKGNNTRNSGN